MIYVEIEKRFRKFLSKAYVYRVKCEKCGDEQIVKTFFPVRFRKSSKLKIKKVEKRR